MTISLPDGLLALLRQASPCFIATLMPDGSPQLTQTWVDTGGAHILINTADGFQKVKNIERDPRVAVAVSDPTKPSRYYAVRGAVLSLTTDFFEPVVTDYEPRRMFERGRARGLGGSALLGDNVLPFQVPAPRVEPDRHGRAVQKLCLQTGSMGARRSGCSAA